MATRMGAPGVRIELHDRSGYSLVETPNAVAGVVGFAPRGELNKIQTLTNTAQQDTYFGLGFNNSKYNQGMYAARAVLNAGGHVEFVRPYGEEIDKTNDFKRDLKTDTFVVAFDRNAASNKNNPDNRSIQVEYLAATRYKTDRASKYGVTRKINNAGETIVNGSNVNFNVDAAEDYTAKTNWISEGGVARGASDMVLFALMNADPSGANRAYTKYELFTSSEANNGSVTDDCAPKSAKDGSGEVIVTSKAKVGFTVDDLVYGLAIEKTIFTSLYLFRVTSIVEKRITLKAEDATTKEAVAGGYIPETLIYSDPTESVADGYDYLTVKTAVAGRGAKTLSSLYLDNDGLAELRATFSGTPIVFRAENGNDVNIRVSTDTFIKGVTVGIENDYKTVTVSLTDAERKSVWIGDKLQLEWTVAGETDSPTHTANYIVTNGEYVSDDEYVYTLSYESSSSSTQLANNDVVTIKNLAKNWVDTLDTLAISVGQNSTTEDVVNSLLEALGDESIGYRKNAILGDIAKDTDDTIIYDADTKKLTMLPGSAAEFIGGDKVAITRASVVVDRVAPEADDGDELFGGDRILFIGEVKSSDPINNTIELTEEIPTDMLAKINAGVGLQFQLLNLTQTNKTAFAAVDKYTFTSADLAMTATEVDYTKPLTLVTAGDSENKPVYEVTGVKVTFADVTDASKDDVVKFKFAGVDVTGTVTKSKVDETDVIVVDLGSQTFLVEGTHVSDYSDEPPTIDASMVADATVHASALDKVKTYADIYLVGNYTTMVPSETQVTREVVELDGTIVGKSDTIFVYQIYAKKDNHIVDRSEKVLVDTSIGATFVSLGLALVKYEDVNFNGDAVRVYDLTDDGEAVARLYLSVAYMYNGIRYEFDGTIVPYLYNDMQLYIGDTAENELEGSGVYFVLNDSDEMNMFREDNSYDLSSTVERTEETGIIPSSTTICPAFNENDPAIINDAVWTYDPVKNMSTSTISNAFNLFMDKDKSEVTFFPTAGLGLNNFGYKGYESLNTQLMQAVLNICELRKDCFALFDGVADSRIVNTLKLDSPASRFGSTLGRWGAIYDARPIFFDSIVTKSNVEAAPSIAMASLITANRSGSIWWHVPAGEDTGMIPGAWCRKLKYERTFNIPEDTESDIARLCDIHVNPFRSNKKGIYCYGDFTMQMEDTAFNALNVTMLVAGIHKMFYNYLDSRVFRLNTASLRAQISTDLQLALDKIIGADPAGLEPGSVVICDDTNNPPEVVEAHKLYVDLRLYPTTSTRYIYLRTNVLSRSTGNTISTEITTGNR